MMSFLPGFNSFTCEDLANWLRQNNFADELCTTLLGMS